LLQLFSASVALCFRTSRPSISIFVRDELVAVATTQFPASSDRALADWLAGCVTVADVMVPCLLVGLPDLHPYID